MTVRGAGRIEDVTTALTYMQQRYYDPEIGLFLSVDPVTAYSNPVAQFQRYRYANNNPYLFVDPDGRSASFRDHPGIATSQGGALPSATTEQKEMVAVASDGHSSPDAAASKFGQDTQQEARREKREPQSGIVETSRNTYGYTKPMWGPKGATIVNVGEYTQALVAVYGDAAVALAHGHFDQNMMFSVPDISNSFFLTYMHNQNGETRRLDAHILRREIRIGGFRNEAHMIQMGKGAHGKCVGGCEK